MCTDLKILRYLRLNSRKSLTVISKAIKIPVTTAFLKLRQNRAIKSYTTLLDFSKLGYPIKAIILIDSINSDILNHPSINSAYKLSSGKLLIESLFKDMKQYYEFYAYIKKKADFETYFVLDELKKEDFLTSESHLKLF